MSISGGQIIALLALLIPIAGIVANNLRKWQKLDLEAARRDVDLRRRFRTFDQIEKRVGDIEAHVTSHDFELNRQIGRLAEKN